MADIDVKDDTPDLVADGGSSDADLFGDEDDDVVPQTSQRNLDDSNLDSGDDINRDDRVATIEEDDLEPERLAKVVPTEVPRISYPPDGEFYVLNMPPFMGVQQKAFDPDTYEVATVSHDGDEKRQTSAYSTAMSSLFWRHDPKDQEKLQSSARFVRWSDGSITLQLATKPNEHFPIAVQPLRQDFKKPLVGNFDPTKDSLTYLSAAHMNVPGVDVQLVHRIDASMKIGPSGGTINEGENRLKSLLQKEKQDSPLARLSDVKEDPELARKTAEQFEKERIRAQRKRENAEERALTKRNQVLGRSGLGPRGGAGLSIAGLEDDMGMPVSRGKKKMMTKRRVNRHGEIYSDDEDDTMPRGRTREDEYDREDDFLVDSDEEPEEYGDDDSLPADEDMEDDLDRADKQAEKARRRDRAGTPKRRAEDEDDDAEGEPDDELLRQSPQQQRKKRRVIDDEEEE